MRILAARNRPLPCITVDYHLMTSSTGPGMGLGDEPIALCTVRLAQAVPGACEECQLVAWHFPCSGRPIAMPVEETCEPAEGGRLLLLARRDLTLVLLDGHGQARSLAQLSLQVSKNRGEGDVWGVAVVWSDGVEVALRKSWPMYLATRVADLSLTEAQCGSFLCLGGLLRAPVRIAGDVISTKVTGSALGAEGVEFALHQERLPVGQVSSGAYTSLQAALLQAGVDLGACWVLLPQLCPGCGSPVLSETARVATLWGWAHPGCAQAEPCLAHPRDPGVSGREWPGAHPYQLALPGIE